MYIFIGIYHRTDLFFYPKQQNKDECTLEGISSRAGDNEIMTKRMELFHYEFQHEQQQYRQQKRKKMMKT